MKSTWKLWRCFAIASIWVRLLSAQGLSPPPKDLAQWGLHCYCLGARATPHNIVRLDDNGQILFRARGGVTLEQLSSEGIAANRSQLKLLEEYGLLRQTGARYTTAFPVLGPDLMNMLRPRLKVLATSIGFKIKAHVGRVNDLARARGASDSDYAVVFGLALDGLFWQKLEKRGLLPQTAPDVAHPYWRGLFWAIYPERNGSSGTNELKQGPIRLIEVWNDRVADRLLELMSSPGLRDSLSSAKDQSARMSAIETEHGERWSLGDNNGKLAIPTIRRIESDPVFHECGIIADIVAKELVDDPSARALLVSVPSTSKETATVILAHELIWDVMDSLVAEGCVRLPAVLKGAPQTPTNLRSLLVLTSD